MREAPEEVGLSGDPLLKAALASMPFGFSIWDENWKLVLYNRPYLDLYGYSPEDLHVGMSLKDMARLTVARGNHPGFSAEEMQAHFAQRLRATEDGRPTRSQQLIGGRVIRAYHARVPGVGWMVTHEDVTADVKRDAELHDEHIRFATAVESMAHGLSMYDAELNLIACNSRYCEMYGIPPGLCVPGTSLNEMLKHRAASGAMPLEIDDVVGHVMTVTRERNSRNQVYRLANGRTVSVSQSPMEPGGFVAVHQDISEDIARLEALKATGDELAVQNMRLAAAVNNISQGLCMFDGGERLVICNEQYARIYNLPPELMVPGTTLEQILDYRFEHGMVPVGGRAAYLRSRMELVANRTVARDVIEMEDGRAIAIHHHPMPDGGWVATHEDISEQRQIEARVQHLATHDSLTDLPNRLMFRREMEKAETRMKRDEVVAVLCVDLDHFKAVNDTLGHAVGDAVLVEVAHRLRAIAREGDLTARLGGDEFALLVYNLESASAAGSLAARIVRAMTKPIMLDEHQVMIGASVGIAVAPADGNNGESLLKKADLALYRAKNDGRGTYHFFEKGMDEALQRRRTLEQGLKLALGRGEFRLVYQPLLKVSNSRVTCVEALLRWDHPERGEIAPMEFIPVAEETGVIGAIGEWVLREACRTAARWPEDIHIAVNLSPVQFKNRALVNQVSSALHDAGLNPTRLELEITESLLLADTAPTLEMLHRLRAIGVRIAMDDFGTGYSSLSYLRSFPFDKIKIDRSFMAGLRPQDDSSAIIRAIIGLGRSLGMSTTAEGIETEDQFRAVSEEGCNEVQGFLFSPPLPASAIDALLGVAPAEAQPLGKSTATA